MTQIKCRNCQKFGHMARNCIEQPPVLRVVETPNTSQNYPSCENPFVNPVQTVNPFIIYSNNDCGVNQPQQYFIPINQQNLYSM